MPTPSRPNSTTRHASSAPRDTAVDILEFPSVVIAVSLEVRPTAICGQNRLVGRTTSQTVASDRGRRNVPGDELFGHGPRRNLSEEIRPFQPNLWRPYFSARKDSIDHAPRQYRGCLSGRGRSQ